MPELLTRDQARALTDRVLAFATADETRVNVRAGWSGNTRFAGGEIMGAFRERIAAQPGEKIKIRPDGNTVHLFDTESGKRISA